MLIRLIFPANEKTCKAAQISENAVDDHLHEWVPYRLGTWWVQFPVGCTGSAIHSAPESCALKRGAQQRWPWSAPAHFCMTCGQGAPLVRLPIPHRPRPFPVTHCLACWWYAFVQRHLSPLPDFLFDPPKGSRCLSFSDEELRSRESR